MTKRRVPVWDLPIRLFHWGLVAAMAGSWWTSDDDDRIELHLLFGYAVLGLVLFRLIWGLVGSDTARFSGFVRSPRATVAYAIDTFRGRDGAHGVGHNPLGAWSVLTLLGLVLVQAVSGLFLSGGDIILVEAPLADTIGGAWRDILEEVHRSTFTLLQFMVGLHLLAILFYAAVKRVDLVRPMITGRAPVNPGEAPRMAPLGRAVVIAATVALAVWLLVRYG